MSFSAAGGPDTETVVEKTSRHGLSTPTTHSIKSDHYSPKIVDAPEKPLNEADKVSLGSGKATSSQSKRSRKTSISFTSTVEYSQTPFDQCVHQVKDLCPLLWPSPPKTHLDVKPSRVERLLAKNRMGEMFLPKKESFHSSFYSTKRNSDSLTTWRRLQSSHRHND